MLPPSGPNSCLLQESSASPTARVPTHTNAYVYVYMLCVKRVFFSQSPQIKTKKHILHHAHTTSWQQPSNSTPQSHLNTAPYIQKACEPLPMTLWQNNCLMFSKYKCSVCVCHQFPKNEGSQCCSRCRGSAEPTLG